MGLQRYLRIYIGFNSPSIIQYLKPQIGDAFMKCFVNCNFDETIFPSLGGVKLVSKGLENNKFLKCIGFGHLDPQTKQNELKVQKIIHMQKFMNQLLDAFTDAKKVTKVNTPTQIDVPIGRLSNIKVHKSKSCLKRGKLVDSKDIIPHIKKYKKKHMKRWTLL